MLRQTAQSNINLPITILYLSTHKFFISYLLSYSILSGKAQNTIFAGHTIKSSRLEYSSVLRSKADRNEDLDKCYRSQWDILEKGSFSKYS